MIKVIILHSQVSADASVDDLDTLVQVEAVRDSLQRLGYEVDCMPFSVNFGNCLSQLQKADFIFNLVEAIDEKGVNVFIPTALLDQHNISYCGCTTENIFLTTNKVLTKKILKANNIPTAPWIDSYNVDHFEVGASYIVKPVSEDASIGLSDKNVFVAENAQMLCEKIQFLEEKSGLKYFAEKYIDGREFNISIMGDTKNPRILPLAEMCFTGVFKEKLKIIGYEAKWDIESPEFRDSYRTFDYVNKDVELLEKLKNIVYQCWEVFGLRGYARLDLRVDKNNNPFVLEINANPCIAPDSGFIAAAEKAGMSYDDVIAEIIKAR